MIQPIYKNRSTDLQKSSLTPENKSERLKRGWGAGADRSRSRLRKKPGAGAAPKNQAGAGAEAAKKYRLLEDKKHKEIVHLLLFFRKNSKLYG